MLPKREPLSQTTCGNGQHTPDGERSSMQAMAPTAAQSPFTVVALPLVATTALCPCCTRSSQRMHAMKDSPVRKCGGKGPRVWSTIARALQAAGLNPCSAAHALPSARDDKAALTRSAAESEPALSTR